MFESKSKTKPSLSKDETLQIYLELELEKTELIVEAYNSGKIKTLQDSQDENLTNSFIGAYPSARAHDKLFIEKKISEEKFEAACKYYRTAEDPKVQNLQTKNFIRIEKAKRNALN